MSLKLLAAGALVATLAVSTASAQQPHWANYDTLETQMFFGTFGSDEKGVSAKDWADFLANEITPRFPDGLTVASVYGQGAGGPPHGVIAENTKMLIVVHPDTSEAAEKLGELKKAYKERFGQTGVFHTRQSVEVVTD